MTKKLLLPASLSKTNVSSIERRILYFLLLIIIVCGCQYSDLSDKSSKNSQVVTPVFELPTSISTYAPLSTPPPTPTTASNDEIVLRVDGLLERNAEQFAMMEIIKPMGPFWESSLNPTGEYLAFHLCEPSCNVFVEDVSSGITYQLFMPDLREFRNFKDLKWSADYILKFKQITAPNIAIQYIVDIEEQKLLDIINYYRP